MKTILEKAQYLCSKKEVCTWDIKMKQRKWELNNDEIENIIEQLVKDDFINEARYSKAFVKDKFNFNKWGRIKIRYELSMRKISQTNINEALEQINEANYSCILQLLLGNKYTQIKHKEETVDTKLQLNNIVITKIDRNKFFIIGIGG